MGSEGYNISSEDYINTKNNFILRSESSNDYEFNAVEEKNYNNNNFLFLSGVVSNESKHEKNIANANSNIENINTREFSNIINNNNIKEPIEESLNTNNENLLIFNKKNSGKILFDNVRKGRPKKGEENKKNKIHTKNSCDNARKKICNSCKLSIYDFIMEYVPSQLGIKLHIPTIEKQMGYSKKSINKFFNKKIYDIFCDSVPKKLKEEFKNNRELYQHNKDIINILLENESKDENKQIKILNGLFNLRFKDFLTAYLNDETEIKIFGDTIISLNGFKTFGTCFNERKNMYTQNQKNLYKKNILELLDDLNNAKRVK